MKDKKDNLYIIRIHNSEGQSMIKLGYSSNIKRRLNEYRVMNPFTQIVYTYYRPDAKKFESWFHMSHESSIMNEWYNEDMLSEMYKCLHKELEEQYTGKHSFYHRDGREHHNVTRMFMKETYGLGTSRSLRLIDGRSGEAFGWSIIKGYVLDRYNTQTLTFYHANGTIEKDVTIKYMSEKYGLSRSGFQQMAYADSVSTNHFWCLDECIAKLHYFKHSIYDFYNTETKETFEGLTVAELIEQQGLTPSSKRYFAEMYNKKRTNYKEWIIKRKHYE